MREFEKGFKDRKGTNTTKKRIQVLERTEHSNGQMTLIANVNRNDSGITEEGTRMDAESMNTAVLELIYNELYGITYTYSESEWVGTDKEWYERLILNYSGPRLYANVEQNDYLNFVIDNAINQSEIEITGGSKLSDLEYETSIDIYINLYSDEECTNFVTRVKKRINYIPSSTSSND